MSTAIAVIGMNYGDEGKGHIVNYFSDAETLNVRFNGGAQASHAVFLSDGRSHIFHHFGAGSLRGARTLLSSHFIINPVIFASEMWQLSKKVAMREVFIDPRCRVTTPYDMLVNEFISMIKKKNDTCGVGINETVQRSTFRQLKINAKDFFEKSDSEIESILKVIANEYLPFRIKELSLPWSEFETFCSIILGDNKAIESFLKLRSWMKEKAVVVWPDDSVVDKFLAKNPSRKIVFEGAQGMLLDQNRKEFMPYLTRSSTGIGNILELLKTVKSPIDLNTYLITRAYLTRHGDGPIWNYIPNTFPFDKIKEETNPENRYQGKMRYGFLSRQWYDKSIIETENRISKDRPICLSNVSVNVAMTCCDHIGKQFYYCENGSGKEIPGNVVDFPRISIISQGKTEKNIKAV